MANFSELRSFCANYFGCLSYVHLEDSWGGVVVKVSCYNILGSLISSETLLTEEPCWSLNNLIPASSQVHVDSALSRTKDTLHKLESVYAND